MHATLSEKFLIIELWPIGKFEDCICTSGSIRKSDLYAIVSDTAFGGYNVIANLFVSRACGRAIK